MIKYLSLAISLIWTIQVVGQPTQSFDTKFGRKDGLNISQVLFKPSLDQIPTLGFITGFCVKDVSEKGLGIQVELSISQMGWKEKLDSSNIYFHRLNYIQFPILTHVALGKGSGKIVLNFGPCLNYLLDEKETIKVPEDFEMPGYYDQGIEQKFGFGLCLGLGYEKTTSVGSFQIECRANQNLFDIFNPTKSEFSMSKNHNIEIGLTYFYTIKNRN